MNFSKILLILVIFSKLCNAHDQTEELKNQVKELKAKYKSITKSMAEMSTTMKYIYPDMPEMDTVRLMTDVNLRKLNKNKFKKFKKQVKLVKTEWKKSKKSMSALMDHYYENICQQNEDTQEKCNTTSSPLLSEADQSTSFFNHGTKVTSSEINALEALIATLLSDMTTFEPTIAAMNEFILEMNTPTPPGDLLLVAVGSHQWTEAHDMNKALNRTCALEVLPDYPHYGSGSGDGGLSYPAGGLVSGRPFFCGGKSGHSNFKPFDIRTECYTLKNNNWVNVANLTTARWQHAGVSFGDSLWVTGGHLQDQTVTKTTEIIHANGTVEDGPDLPKKRDCHCMVLLPPGTKVMILGADKGNKKTVTIFDRMTEKFTKGDDMNYDRERAACTIFKSPKHGNRPVVFIGGGKDQNTAEILDFSQSGAKWEIVSSMPSLYPYITNFGGARAVPTPSMDGVILIYGPDFWELKFKNGQWVMKEMTPMPQLAISRQAWPIVEYIDENLIDVTGLCV